MRRCVVVAAVAWALTGCAGHGAGVTGAGGSSLPTPTAPPPPSSTWVSPYDAKVMLGRDAPLADLRRDLETNLQLLDTIRAEVHEPTSPLADGWVVLDVDYVGNCSGTLHLANGAELRVVKRGKLSVSTTDDGAIGEALDGHWVEADDQQQTAAFCDRGAAAFVDHRTADNRGTWLLTSGRKLGMENVRGKSALHVRQRVADTVYDVWVAALQTPQDPTDHKLYPVKIVSHRGDDVTISYFSRFNTAVVDRLPPRSDILDADATQA